MPLWLSNQLKRAFFEKDRKQIALLNDCWFFYRSNMNDDEQDNEFLSDHSPYEPFA